MPLQEYKDMFAFRLAEMLSVDLAVIEHHLNVDPMYMPMATRKGTGRPSNLSLLSRKCKDCWKQALFRNASILGGYQMWCS